MPLESPSLSKGEEHGAFPQSRDPWLMSLADVLGWWTSNILVPLPKLFILWKEMQKVVSGQGQLCPFWSKNWAIKAPLRHMVPSHGNWAFHDLLKSVMAELLQDLSFSRVHCPASLIDEGVTDAVPFQKILWHPTPAIRDRVTWCRWQASRMSSRGQRGLWP